MRMGVWILRSVIALSVTALVVTSPSGLCAQEPAVGVAAENVVLVTLDGLRGEEVFGGADVRLMIEELGCEKPDEILQRYASGSPVENRRTLLPFLWKQIDQGGWIAGDWERDSQVEVTNGRFFSYPGYNEILCGFADPNVDSNAKKYNANRTVLEWLNGQPDYQGRVAAFCSWDVFPFIINDRRSGISVNAGWQPITTGRPDVVQTLNYSAEHLFHEWAGVRYDVFTASAAIEAMLTTQPRVLYVALGETDDWAHAGRYDRYLLTAQQNDAFIRRLWEQSQRSSHYRDRTAFLITTDHGRGGGREGWKNHGAHLPGSERIWVAAFGAGVTAKGPDEGGRFRQAQVAATVAALLGEDFCAANSQIDRPLPIH